MRKTSPTEKTRLLLAVAGGLVAFAAGLVLARVWLPEWRAGRLPEEGFYVARHHEIADQLGVRLVPGEPRVTLAANNEERRRAARELEDRPSGLLAGPGTGVLAEVAQEGTLPAGGGARELAVRFSPAGQPVAVSWLVRGPAMMFEQFRQPPAPQPPLEALTRLLLAPGESLGERREITMGSLAFYYEIVGSEVPQHLVVAQAGGISIADRRTGSLQSGLAEARQLDVAHLLLQGLPRVLGFLAVIGLFLVLATSRHIALGNGAILAAITFAASAPTALVGDPSPGLALGVVLVAAARAAWVFLVWSAGESFLRSVQPGFTTSLDALRAGRLGPRGGRALLYGIALGALFAGLRLAFAAAAAALPGAWPRSATVRLPVFGDGSPLTDGIALAGAVAVALAFAYRLLPARRAPWGAAVAGALAIAPLGLHPYPLALMANLVLVGLLVVLGRRLGLTTLLTAALTSFLLPAAAFSALHLAWLPASFAITAGLSVAILVAGVAGLSRSPETEAERVEPPAFVRRLEDERRLRYEMDLLARMQRGLLPSSLPKIPGWEIAARSMIANEAGGDLYDVLFDDAGHLWIAAGDVSGHGYSCSIAQAMTTAALASLIAPGRSPAEVLRHADRVLRRRGTARSFTSLVLLRLDPGSGEAVLSNAGHPYPILLAGGEVRELALPSLPLGQGPEREYQDLRVEIPAGVALVLCSDGLFEATDRQGAAYGFERPRRTLHAAAAKPAAAILDSLLADWRRHLGTERPLDDTTVLVIKRVAVHAGREAGAAGAPVAAGVR